MNRHGKEEGEVYVPERYKEMMLRSMPGIFIYRGLKENKKTSGHPYHDLNILRPETIAEVYKTCSESDSGSFSESDDFDVGDVIEGSSYEGLRTRSVDDIVLTTNSLYTILHYSTYRGLHCFDAYESMNTC